MGDQNQRRLRGFDSTARVITLLAEGLRKDVVLGVDQHQKPACSGCGSAGDRGNGCHGCLQLELGNQPMRRKSPRLSVLMLAGWY